MTIEKATEPRSWMPAAFTLVIWVTYDFTRFNNIAVWTMGIYFLILGWPYRRFDLRKDYLYLLPVLLLTCYIVGMLWASSERMAWQQVEKRLPLLVFPFMFFVIRDTLSPYQLRMILIAFVMACIMIILFCLGHAVANIIEHQSLRVVELRERQYFYFSYLPLTQPAAIDPIYLSMYINFSIVVVLETMKRLKWKVPLIVFLIVANVLVASKIGLGVMMLLLFVSVLIRLRNRLYALIVCAIIALGALLFLQRATFLRDRLFVETKFDFHWDYSGAWNSITQRLAIWTCAADALKEKFPLGYGTADGQLALHKAYVEHGYIRGFEDNYNAHNEYLYAALDLGIFGIVALLVLLAVPLVRSWSTGNSVFAYFIVICAAYFLVEVVLSRRAGVNFFGFMFSVLATLKRPSKKD
ncbi:O-antigen ligase family protein [Chryseolinea sp. T2]|uniref:O-antigen ligase family protein n=1 Tax=Chryseolinea sp. T2 TaxID=3129255 RepID=UPI003076AAF4